MMSRRADRGLMAVGVSQLCDRLARPPSRGGVPASRRVQPQSGRVHFVVRVQSSPFTSLPAILDPGSLHLILSRDPFPLRWNYVMPNGTYAGFAAATSRSPFGPFKVRRDSVAVKYQNPSIQAGDFHLFVDDDDTGYVIYSAGEWVLGMGGQKLEP
jgi:hypothetical protein